MGPTGMPGDGPDKKWKVPFYAVKLACVLAYGLVGSAVDGVRDAWRDWRKRKQDAGSTAGQDKET